MSAIVANAAPQVRFISPQDGQILAGPTDIRLVAYAQDREEGYHVNVEFFEGTNSLGFGTFVPSLCPAPYCPNFVLPWSNVSTGAYTLTAVASDSTGASTRSDPIHIKVVDEQANQRPKVQIVKPQNGETFAWLSDIEIAVRAQDPDGWVHTVEFFANNVKIGEQSVEFIQAPPPNQEQMFSLVWSKVTTGRYALTARAIDDQGFASTSDPVFIAVGEVLPLVPVVSIIAIDSLASEHVSTNGTNTAVFKIYRTGPTNLDLTVFYSVHGTASNGVDYVEIGNSATIPAGRHATRIVIVPIDDDLKEDCETVVLKLEPDPTLGAVARYEIGRPDKAAAIIVDNDLDRPTSLRLPDGSFRLCVEKPDGFAFRLELSEDLSTWVPLCTNVVTDGALQFVDPEALQLSRRFYRIVPQSNYVPEE